MAAKLLGRAYMRLALLAICIILIASVLLDVSASHKHHASSESPEVPTEIKAEKILVPQSGGHASIGKITMVYGDPEPVYERGLRLHNLHNKRFGYPIFLLSSKTLPEYWSKPAYILKVLLGELEKPEGDRLKWLMWVDADVVLMNQNIPLEIFIPSDERSDVHLLVTDDYHGLNNGVFFIRVHEWSVWLMSAVTSLKIYNPHVKLRFGDQSALELLIKTDKFRKEVRHVPQYWFNGYAGSRGKPDPLPTALDRRPGPSNAKEGALLVHFPAHYAIRARRMNLWLNEAEQHQSPWEVPLNETWYMSEIEQYWEHDTELEETIWRNDRKRRKEEERLEREAEEHQQLYEKQLALEAQSAEEEKIEAETLEAEKASLETEHREAQKRVHWWGRTS